MCRLFLLILFICWSAFACSQSFLYLKKLGGKQAIVYKEGDEIRFQMKDDEHFAQGIIESFGEDHFVIHETIVKLSDIYRYDIRGISNNSFNYRFSSNTLIFAGGILPLAELANQQVSDSGENKGIHGSVWTASGLLVVGGLLLRWLEPKYFKPGWKRKATIIQK